MPLTILAVYELEQLLACAKDLELGRYKIEVTPASRGTNSTCQSSREGDDERRVDINMFGCDGRGRVLSLTTRSEGDDSTFDK